MTANPVILTMKIMRRGPRAAKGKGGRLLGKAAPGHGTVAKILILEGFDLAPIRRALNSCVNIFNLYGCF